MSKPNHHFVAGVIGGLGPQATVDFYQKIINLTPAKRDQDHLHVIIDSFPQIPDRTSAILGTGEDPTPHLLESAKRLEQLGVAVIAVPCNSAHVFLESVRQAVQVPILNMISLTADAIKRKFEAMPQGQTCQVGLLATTGTVKAGLYQKTLSAIGVQVLLPKPRGQDEIMAAITQIKAKELSAAAITLSDNARQLAAQGADFIIAGCTEIPLVLNENQIDLPIIDTTDVLAREVIRLALSK